MFVLFILVFVIFLIVAILIVCGVAQMVLQNIFVLCLVVIVVFHGFGRGQSAQADSLSYINVSTISLVMKGL